jgi:hypothetical protein
LALARYLIRVLTRPVCRYHPAVVSKSLSQQ